MYRVNIGCGSTPTLGWLNFDNSLTVKLAALPLPYRLLARNGRARSLQFISVAREHGIKWADGAKNIPLGNASVEVLYTSHTLEHLDKQEAILFLREAERVLIPGGIIRVVVPDLRLLINEYIQTGDADDFVAKT